MAEKMAAPFNVKYQKNNFFKMAQINEKRMNPVQVREMTKSFYAGFGSCLVLMKNEIADLPMEKGILALQAMLNECQEFWTEEAERHAQQN